MVAAIARKTFRDADAASLADFTARLGALASAQALLIDAETQPMLLADIVKDALAAHNVASRCSASGPPLTVNGRQAHALALALHELATNAAKYGALSIDTGHVDVTWSDADNAFDFLWTERGGPIVVTPTRRGLGSALITQNLESAFSGKVELSYEPRGVQCRLRALSARDRV